MCKTPYGLRPASQIPEFEYLPYLKPDGCVWLMKQKEWLWLYNVGDFFKTEIPVYDWASRPADLFTINQLRHRNLKPRIQSATCVIRDGARFTCLFSLTDTEVIDPTLPPYCPNGSNPELKTERDLKKLNLSVVGVNPRGFYRWYDRYDDCHTVLLYHPDDCNWEPRDRYITKTTLKQTYLLSDKWIKRLGKPDLITENPHHHKFSDMQLYSKQRVEAFLAENAEEYAHWLDERDRHVLIFELNREAIEAGRAAANKNRLAEKQALSEQTALCLRCASGCAMPKGFLCAIHPMGLELHQIPCPDWIERVYKSTRPTPQF